MTESRSAVWTTTAPRRPTSHAAPARRRTGRWIPLVAVLAVVAVAALLLGLRGATDRAGSGSVAAVPTAVIPGAGAAAAPTAPVPGSLTAESTSLFAAASSGDQGLAGLAGETAAGHAVPVQSVPADEGFWIGDSTTDRVWVQFTANRESTVTITPGQLLDLRGPVVPHGADFAAKAGVAAADGAAQLTREGAHLEVDPAQVKVVGRR